MKILQISLTYPPRKFGGITAATHNLSKNLVAKGHDVTVYTTDVGDSPSSRLHGVESNNNIDGVKVRYFKNISNRLAFNHNVYLSTGMFSALRNELSSFDIIHTHGYRSFQDIMMHRCVLRYNVPYVIEVHGGVLPIMNKINLKRFYDRFFGIKILADANRVIAGNVTEINEYKMMGVRDAQIALIPPLYDLDYFDQLPPDGLFKNKYNIKYKHIILFLGRINKIKGLDFLIRSFHKLSRDRHDVMLVIAGPDQGYRIVLDKLIEELNLDKKVLFTGILYDNDKLEALVDATMLVQTSIYERGPGSPFEAVLCGKPIIVTRNTGAGEMVEKIDAGYLVDYGDIEELNKTMQEIISNPVLAQEKVKNGRDYIIKNLSWQKKVEDYEKMYKLIIEEF